MSIGLRIRKVVKLLVALALRNSYEQMSAGMEILQPTMQHLLDFMLKGV